MQFEFSDQSNRVFSKARGALILIAFAAFLELLVLIFFYGHNLGLISKLQLSTQIGNIVLFFALAFLLSQSFSALRPLRLIVNTTGSDLSHLLRSLRLIAKSLFCVAVVFLLNNLSALYSRSEWLSCLKAS
jgi:hypothetical protein